MCNRAILIHMCLQVNCAPYSHSHPDELQPTSVESAWEAQQKCAADKKCMVRETQDNINLFSTCIFQVYMYVDADAADARPEDRGKVRTYIRQVICTESVYLWARSVTECEQHEAYLTLHMTW